MPPVLQALLFGQGQNTGSTAQMPAMFVSETARNDPLEAQTPRFARQGFSYLGHRLRYRYGKIPECWKMSLQVTHLMQKLDPEPQGLNNKAVKLHIRSTCPFPVSQNLNTRHGQSEVTEFEKKVAQTGASIVGEGSHWGRADGAVPIVVDLSSSRGMCKRERECPIVWGRGGAAMQRPVPSGGSGIQWRQLLACCYAAYIKPVRRDTEENLGICVEEPGLGKWLACSTASETVPLGEFILYPSSNLYHPNSSTCCTSNP